GAVGVDHVLHRVGNDVPGGETVEHPVMAHGDTIIHGDCVELLGNAARFFDLACNQLTQVFQVDVTGYKLGKGVGHCDDGLLKVVVLHACGAPQCPGASHIASGGGSTGTICGH